MDNKGIKGLITELRRRRVFRVAAVYLGTAFVILEASEMIFPRLGLPDWTVSFIMLLLGLGFPLAIILSWFFEITPDGFSKTQGSKEKQTKNEKPLTGNSIIISLLVVIIVLLAYPRFFGNDAIASGPAAPGNNSIAVLPFTSFSNDETSEHFSDGITDVILTQLAKIRDLKVISRTSIMQYKNTEKPIRQIANELGVANVLEGSVQRAGDKVRIVSQLIKADTDEHLWAETYDRDYADIFDLQSEVARAIASALKITLTPEEENYIEQKPTENQEAWDLYIESKLLLSSLNNLNDREFEKKYINLLERSSALDPKFILPRAHLVRKYSNMYFNNTGADYLTLAEEKMREIERIGIDSPEAHMAKGYLHYYSSRNYKKALDEFEIAMLSQPNDSELHEAVAYVYRRLGRWDESLASLIKASDLNPNDLGLVNAVMEILWNMRRYEERMKYLARLSTGSGGESSFIYQTIRIWAELAAYGDLGLFQKRAEQIKEQFGNNPNAYFPLRVASLFNRDYETALYYVKKDTADLYFNQGSLFRLMGQSDSSKFYFEKALQKNLNTLKKSSNDIEALSSAATVYAALGNKDLALKHIEKALQIMPLSKDALVGKDLLSNKMDIYFELGMMDEGFDLLEEQLESPGGVHIIWSVLAPDFHGIKKHPRYKPIIMKYLPRGWDINKI